MNGHDFEDPMSFVAGVDALMEATQVRCAHCLVRVTTVPLLGTRYGLVVDHEPGCPDHDDDDSPAVEYVVPPEGDDLG